MEKIKLKLDTPEAKKRWKLIKEASKEVDGWDELKKAEACQFREEDYESESSSLQKYQSR